MKMAKKTKADPSGQRVNRKRSRIRLQRRIRKAKRRVIDLFRDIPVTRKPAIQTNADLVYRYDMTVEQKEEFQRQVRRIIALEVVGTEQQDRVPIEWWFKPDLELPTRQGYSEEVIQFNQLVKIANRRGIPGRNGLPAQIIPVELALTTTDYTRVLNEKYLSGFNAIKTLSDRTADQVIRVIGSGIQAGNSPGTIVAAITERFDVSQSDAKRTVTTEVNQAYNQAKLQAVEMASEQTGLNSGVIHISALLVTTRRTHAARHGNLYTVHEQQQFWAESANAINCHCTTKPALIDDGGNIVPTE